MTSFGELKDCNLYTVIDNQNLIGQFVCNSQTAYILTEDDCLQIYFEPHLLNKSEYIIIDKKSNLVVGYYDLPFLRFCWKTVGSLTFNGQTYLYQRQKADIRHNIFKKHSWGNYKMASANGTFKITYKIKVDTNWINTNDREFRNAEGEIESNQTNRTLILAGLFLIEKMLFNVDIDTT